MSTTSTRSTTSDTSTAQNAELLEKTAALREQLLPCMQCGTCSGSCPNSFAMDFSPRHLWRLVQLGQFEAVFASRTFVLCSSCYTCKLRCPRGLPLKDAMASLKQLAFARGLGPQRSFEQFYLTFMDNIKRYGRVQETELMMRYFSGQKNPLVPLRYALMGLKLMHKRKIPLPFIEKKAENPVLQRLFAHAAQRENNP